MPSPRSLRQGLGKQIMLRQGSLSHCLIVVVVKLEHSDVSHSLDSGPDGGCLDAQLGAFQRQCRTYCARYASCLAPLGLPNGNIEWYRTSGA